MISLARQIRCVERELSFRKRVYGKRVFEGRMKQKDADEEIEAMTAVLATLQDLTQPDLPLGEGGK